MGRRFSEGSWARWGVLASACALGAALVLATWSNHRNVADAAYALHEGQARILEREVMGALRRGFERDGPDPFAAILDTLLTQQEESGLRYLAMLGDDGAVVASAGTPAVHPDGAPIPTADPWFHLEQRGSRVRATFARPRSAPAPARGDTPPPEPPPPPVDPGRGRGRRPGGIVVEFEPLAANRLADQARGLLVFGLATAAVLVAVSITSWGVYRRYERAMTSLEQQKRLSLVGGMSAVLAHEIRNPLASLKGHAQLLAERIPPESPERRKIDRIVLEASRLETLTADLLDFVRTGPLDVKPADPAALLRTAAEEVDSSAFGLDLAQAPASWPLDAPRLRQVLVNLLRNALQACPGRGLRAEVSMRVERGRLMIGVRDHGDGLPRGQEDRIFDPFFTTRATGTGLGLAVARRIVELHGGTLEAANHPEGGARFVVALPGDRG